MATPNRPVIGNLYSPYTQSKIHGSNPHQCAPHKDGKVLLLRVHPDVNPDVPRIIDWESPNDPWVETIATQGGTLPVYIFRRSNEWEYMGQFRVTHVATDARALAERSRIVGLTISYAIHLERS
jgi:hypothetical protein